MLAGKLASARRRSSACRRTASSGSAAPAQLETALQLLYQEFTAPGDDPEAFALLKRQLDAAVANRGRAPGQVFGEKLAQVNTSNHYTVAAADARARRALEPRRRCSRSTSARFANAADFTFFMVGAFKVDEALPLLAHYVGSLPSTGKPTSTFKDVGIHFPDAPQQRARSKQGREPRSQTVISFFADPSIDPMEQEKIMAATTVLDIALRDILREDLGPDLHRLGRPVAGAAAARRRPRRGALRRGAGEHARR